MVQGSARRTKLLEMRCSLLGLLLALAACSSNGSAHGAGPIENTPDEGDTPIDAGQVRRDAGAPAASSGRDSASEPWSDVDAQSSTPTTAQDGGATSDASSAPPRKPRPIDRGSLPGPVSGGKGVSSPTGLTPVDLAAHGYVEEEFFLEGDANAYASKGERGIDGVWQTTTSGQAHYKTRVLVRRPARVEDFNGTAFIEWLNVTGSIDVGMGFAFAWEEMLRGGYAYVGVSVQKAGVDALKSGDADRYGSLVHPGDAYAYDIFTQAGAAIGWPGEVNALKGYDVKRSIAYGESQSAMRMITYVNAVHPLGRVFDSFIIHSRAGWGAPVGTESDGFLGDGKPVHVRADTDVPVLQFFTESEIFLSLGPAFAARQPDSERTYTWEVAGTAHADQRITGADPNPICGLTNGGQQHFVLKAAVRAVHRWLKDGVAPPHGTPITANADGTAIARDAHGNALGGIRTPAVDVPISTLSGEAAPANAWNPICMLLGHTIAFTPEVLRDLYPSHQTYVDGVTRVAHAAVEAGFVLPEDEVALLAEAMDAAVPP